METLMYDAVVMGPGPGGIICTTCVSQSGLRTAVVDREWLGGVCLNVGCIPLKSRLKNTEVIEILRQRDAELGYSRSEEEQYRRSYGRS